MKQVAIITGAANNIGLAIAQRFSAEFKVVGLDRVFDNYQSLSVMERCCREKKSAWF